MFKIIAAVIALLYLINCCTPLRLHVDMLRYFAIKDCIELGCPPDSDAAKDYMPVGYTALLLAFSKLGILKSWTIVLLNCLYLFGGLWLVMQLFRDKIHPFFFLAIVLLNWTIIKFVTHPLSEMQYLFFSTASIYFFHRYSQEKRLLFLLSSFALGGLAFLTRSVGIALFAALVTGLLWQYRKELIILVKKNKVLVVLVVLAGIGVIAFSKQLGLNHYTGVFSKQKEGGLSFGDILKGHFIEWTEICFNLSVAKVSGILTAPKAELLFLLAGVVLFVGIVYLVFFKIRDTPFIVKAYLFFYFVLMMNWPFYDPRFWVPIFPLMIIVLLSSPIIRWNRHFLVRTYLVAYFVAGAITAALWLYTGFNKQRFARSQAGGIYQKEYEIHFFGRPQLDSIHYNQDAINILRRYDKYGQ